MTSPGEPRQDATAEGLRSDSRDPTTESGRRLLTALGSPWSPGSRAFEHMVEDVWPLIIAIETEARGDLSTAWEAAESALPEGHYINALEHRWQTATRRDHADGTWTREYEFPAGLPAYRVTTYAPTEPEEIEAWGTTPGEALRALAAVLEALSVARSTEQGGAG